jgi:hypothetical protein
VVVGGDLGLTPAALEEEGNGELGANLAIYRRRAALIKKGWGGTFLTESDELRCLGVDNECRWR